MEQQVLSMLKEYSRLVEKAIERYMPRKFTQEEAVRLFGVPRFSYEPESLTRAISEPFWDLMDRGGKRWRPVLLLITYEALGGKAEDIVDMAIIPEIVHNGTLIVDDVEDNGDFRRGKECIHKIYGVDIAVNVGNTMYYLPLLGLLNDKRVPPDKMLAIMRCYVEEMLRLSLGQAMDIAWHKGLVEEITEEHYMQMCAFKTGSLSRMAVGIAGIMAGADHRLLENLKEFAESLSIAFQIQDDILNIVGDMTKYGKEIGGDIKEGKRTLMVIYALKHLSKDEANRLKEILSLHTSEPSLIEEAIALIRKSGAIEYASKVARELVSKSWSMLDALLPETPAKKKLKALADFLITREF
ncbi:MAG: polyprenyl synthetase family protein [Nitrososphaerota archaeon]|nr:polyprenyl synthetase family protein [Nitrososphaerota archaeon]